MILVSYIDVNGVYHECALYHPSQVKQAVDFCIRLGRLSIVKTAKVGVVKSNNNIPFCKRREVNL